MITYLIIGIVLLVLLSLMLFKDGYDSKMRLNKLMEEAKNNYGKLNDKKMSTDDLNRTKALFYRYINDDSIDDITASDLNLDEIFENFNNCLSAPGRDYFYYKLRNPEYDQEKLDELDKKVSFFQNNRYKRNELRAFFLKIGNMRKANFFDCIDLCDTIEKRSLVKDTIAVILMIISLILIAFNASLGVICLIATICFNIIDYYKSRGEIESYIIFFSYISNFLKNSKEIEKIDCDCIKDDLLKLKELNSEVKEFDRFSFVVTQRSSANIGAGNPLDILLDYFKMTLHIDIFIFYRMLNVLKEKKKLLEEIYIQLGKIETYINIASVRDTYKATCVPTKGEGIKGVNLYHPLIKEPVKNSIEADRGVLITGSNASGKSTFLKTVALNSIFAKTINTALADSFSMDNYHVFSSMSLRDDIVNEDSYFMVEIKALKRIYDYAEKNSDKKVLCFVDEVLRGTNTIERISSVTQILSSLSSDNILCFAATHDIELTDLCKDIYDNYHFEENIIEGDIIFNYQIYKGKATSRNAIKLLGLLGFDKELVDNAQKMAEDFSKTGVWRKENN